MDWQKDQISEHFLSARERSLEEKIVRLENQLQGYKSHIDVLDNQRKKLEERTLSMESALTETKKQLLEAKKELLDKELAEIQLSEKLKSMTLQAEEYKRLFDSESSKNRFGKERMDTLISNLEAKPSLEATPNQFESFKEMISLIQDAFQVQITMMLDKLTEAQDKLYRSPKSKQESNFVVASHGQTVSEQDQGSPNEAPEEITAPQNFLFGSASVASLSFQSVAASSLGNSPFGKETPDKSPGFVGAGSQLFDARKTDDDDNTAVNDHHDGPHFEPIIPLPDKIDVQTGEENEEVMFSHRAKLYRFVAEDKQWKERGVGDIKLLRNNLTGIMRVLMRREQVLKLCANHHITTDMKLQPNAGSERSWVWSTAADFSEEGCKPERLAVRFKTEGIAKRFKEKFEECQEILKNQASLKLQIQEEAANEEKVEEGLLAKFKVAEGSWECDVCMVRNDSDKLECVACASSKPGVEAAQVPPNIEKPLFGSGVPTSGAGFTFGSAALSAGTEVSFGSISASGSTGQSGSENPFSSFSAPSNFTFGSSNQTPSPKPGVEICEEKKTAGKPVFPFGSSTTPSGSTFSFGAAAPSSGSGITFGSGGAGFTFGSAGASDGGAKPLFTFGSLNQDKVEENLLVKFKVAEGSWECDVCMVRKDRHKLECAACASPKPGVEVSEEKKTFGKPVFPFGSSTAPSGSTFSFGAAAPSSGSGITFGSGGAGFTFGSARSSDVGVKSPFTFGSLNQDKVKEDVLAKFKVAEGSWECDVCMVRNDRDKLECAACASTKPAVEITGEKRTFGKPVFPSGSSTTPSRSTFSFRAAAPSSGSGITFGSGGTGFTFGSAGASDVGAKPLFTFGSLNQDKEDLLAKFKAAEGSWECDVCMVVNDSDKLACAACASPKPGV